MKRIYITQEVRYTETFIPPRCRKPRLRERTQEVRFSLRSVTEEEAPIAFICNDYHHTHNTLETPEIRLYKGKLYSIMTDADLRTLNNGEKNRHLHPEDAQRIQLGGRCYESTLEDEIAAYKKAHSRLLVINNQLWEQCGEPRYVVMTFGLGHNHGGTALMVSQHYNDNISKTRYFNALHGKEAVAEATRIAQARGDTNSLGEFKEDIEVLIPEAVKCNPQRQHGNGNPFLNKLYGITESAKDTTSAALLVMATALKENE